MFKTLHIGHFKLIKIKTKHLKTKWNGLSSITIYNKIIIFMITNAYLVLIMSEALSTLYILIHLILTMILWGKNYSYSTNGETEA